MFKNFLVGAILGLLTVILLAVMYNFVTGMSIDMGETKVFSTLNAYGIIIAYGIAMLLIGSLVDRVFTKKKK